jgi:hypothetical protein
VSETRKERFLSFNRPSAAAAAAAAATAALVLQLPSPLVPLHNPMHAPAQRNEAGPGSRVDGTGRQEKHSTSRESGEKMQRAAAAAAAA